MLSPLYPPPLDTPRPPPVFIYCLPTSGQAYSSLGGLQGRGLARRSPRGHLRAAGIRGRLFHQRGGIFCLSFFRAHQRVYLEATAVLGLVDFGPVVVVVFCVGAFLVGDRKTSGRVLVSGFSGLIVLVWVAHAKQRKQSYVGRLFVHT